MEMRLTELLVSKKDKKSKCSQSSSKLHYIQYLQISYIVENTATLATIYNSHINTNFYTFISTGGLK